MTNTRTSPLARDPLIDIAKGIAIIAIVLGHALRGLFAADIIIPTPKMIALDVWLYSWHLAVFALLSGLFVRRSVLRAGRGPYLARRLLLFGWLYLLWSFVQGITKLAVPSGTNSPISWQSLLTLWLPDGQLWFLPWLAIMTAFAVLTSPWASRARAMSVLSLALAVSVVSWGWSGLVIGTQDWGLLIFYAIGLVVGPDRFVATLRRVPGGVAFLTGLGFLSLTAVAVAYAPVTPPSTYGELRTAISVALGLVVSGLGVLGVSLLARVVRRSQSWRVPRAHRAPVPGDLLGPHHCSGRCALPAGRPGPRVRTGPSAARYCGRSSPTPHPVAHLGPTGRSLVVRGAHPGDPETSAARAGSPEDRPRRRGPCEGTKTIDEAAT